MYLYDFFMRKKYTLHIDFLFKLKYFLNKIIWNMLNNSYLREMRSLLELFICVANSRHIDIIHPRFLNKNNQVLYFSRRPMHFLLCCLRILVFISFHSFPLTIVNLCRLVPKSNKAIYCDYSTVCAFALPRSSTTKSRK